MISNHAGHYWKESDEIKHTVLGRVQDASNFLGKPIADVDKKIELNIAEIYINIVKMTATTYFMKEQNRAIYGVPDAKEYAREIIIATENVLDGETWKKIRIEKDFENISKTLTAEKYSIRFEKG